MKKFWLFVVLLLGLVANSAFAGFRDLVEDVYSCGDNIIIRMRDAGPVIIVEAEVGERRLDRMFAIALTLLTTGKPTGYFNEGELIDTCGGQQKKITVLQILRE